MFLKNVYLATYTIILTETIKVFDGNASKKRKAFRTITISRNATKDQIISACLRAFHIHDDPRNYIIIDAYGKFLFIQKQLY